MTFSMMSLDVAERKVSQKYHFDFTKIKEQHLGEKVDKGNNYNQDPTGQRTGNRPDDMIVDILIRTVQDLEDFIDKVYLFLT